MHDPSLLTTFGYYKATRNYIAGGKFGEGGSLDIQKWPCIFVYDVLQLPGTLANLLGHEAGLDVLEYMTVAKVDMSALTKQQQDDVQLDPIVVVKDKMLQGMAVFGRGKINRDALSKFYGLRFRRRTVDVTIRLSNGKKETLKAYAWFPQRQGEKRPTNSLEESPPKRKAQDVTEW